MISAVLIFLAWGSYLNSLGYRLLHLEHFFTARSFCPSCKSVISWYDNIPIISWLRLKAQCRSCKQPISWLYPFIELISTCFLLLLWHTTPTQYFPAYFIFFSALIVTIRTDFDQMLISRYMTLYLIPAGIIAAFIDKVPLSPILSVTGLFFGYLILWCVKKVSYYLTKEDGLGQGDLELLSFIGVFTGPLGCWIALLIGSTFGSLITIVYMAISKQKIKRIPFGSYLSFGAMIFVLFQSFFIHYFSI